jgi:hypothetical protein
MNRRTHARAGLTLAIVAIASLIPMAVMTAVASAEAAGDEYVLEVPGISNDSAAGGSGAAAPMIGANSDQVGVVGENAPPSSPLDALGSALSETPLVAGLLIALIAVAGLVLVASKTTQSRSGTA